MSNSIWDYPIATIEKALELRKKIEALNENLAGIFGGAAKEVTAKAVDGRRGKRSPAARARMAAAQKARWAKKNGAAAAPAPVLNGAKKKRTMSPEARERIAAAQRARWAKQKKA